MILRKKNLTKSNGTYFLKNNKYYFYQDFVTDIFISLYDNVYSRERHFIALKLYACLGSNKFYFFLDSSHNKDLQK